MLAHAPLKSGFHVVPYVNACTDRTFLLLLSSVNIPVFLFNFQQYTAGLKEKYSDFG